MHSLHATSPSFYHVEVTGEKTKLPLTGPPFWGSGRRAVFVLLPTDTLVIRSSLSLFPSMGDGQLLPLTIFHFHSVLSLTISHQGHRPPSFSPPTVKPYWQAEHFTFQEIQLRVVVVVTFETHFPLR